LCRVRFIQPALSAAVGPGSILFIFPEGHFMSTLPGPQKGIDIAAYDRNRRNIPPEVLEPYAGQWVAISGDGTRVLASGPDLATAEANLAALGIPGNAVGWERIPGPGEETWL
jgi:hypothetical protein